MLREEAELIAMEPEAEEVEVEVEVEDEAREVDTTEVRLKSGMVTLRTEKKKDKKKKKKNFTSIHGIKKNPSTPSPQLCPFKARTTPNTK